MQLFDYARYYRWHLAGELGMDTSGLLSPDEFNTLHTGVSDEEGCAEGQICSSYGHGWIIYEDGGPYPNLGRVLEHEGSNSLWDTYVVMAPDVDRVYFLATNSWLTKQGKKSVGVLVAMLENMIATDKFENATCTSIDILDEGRDPGGHASCPILVYGEQ